MGTSITYGIFGDLVWGLQAEFLETLFGAYRPPVQVQIPVLGGSLRGSGGVLGAGVSDTPGPGGSSGALGEVLGGLLGGSWFGGSGRAWLACGLNGTKWLRTAYIFVNMGMRHAQSWV